MKARLSKLLKEDGITLRSCWPWPSPTSYSRTPGDTFASVEELESGLMTGKPTVVEFYSNTCSICLVSKPKAGSPGI